MGVIGIGFILLLVGLYGTWLVVVPSSYYEVKNSVEQLSMKLAPANQLLSPDSPTAYDNNQCECNWFPETILLLDQAMYRGTLGSSNMMVSNT